MSKTKGVTKLVINTDTDPTPQEPSLVESETTGLFIHSTNALIPAKIWLSQGSGSLGSFSKLEYDTDFGFKISTDIPLNVSHDATLRFVARGTEYWNIEGLNGSSGDLLPVIDNTLKIGRSGFNLAETFSRKLTSDSTLAIASGGSTKWNLDTSGHLVPISVNQNIGSSSFSLDVVYGDQIFSGTGQVLWLGSDASAKWYIATGSNSALVPNSSSYDFGTSLNRISTAYTQTINNSGDITTNNLEISTQLAVNSIRTRNIGDSLTVATGTGFTTRWTINSSGNLSATGALNITTTGTIAGGPITGTSLDLGSGSIITSLIGRNTSDGADNGWLELRGGGNSGFWQNRGAVLQLLGNEFSGTPGFAYLYAGEVANSEVNIGTPTGGGPIRFITANTEKLRIESSGNVEPNIADTYRIGNGNRFLSIDVALIRRCDDISVNGGLMTLGPISAHQLDFRTNNTVKWSISSASGQLSSSVSANIQTGGQITGLTGGQFNSILVGLSSSNSISINGSDLDFILNPSGRKWIMSTTTGNLRTNTNSITLSYDTGDISGNGSISAGGLISSNNSSGPQVVLNNELAPAFGRIICTNHLKMYVNTSTLAGTFISTGLDLTSDATGTIGVFRSTNDLELKGNSFSMFVTSTGLNLNSNSIYNSTTITASGDITTTTGDIRCNGEIRRITSGALIFRPNQFNNSQSIVLDITSGGTGSLPTLKPFQNGNVHLGDPSFRWDTIYYNTLNPPSDIRLKEDIQEITNAKAVVNGVLPKKFKWKRDGKQTAGFIAQEFVDVVPEGVFVGSDENVATDDPEFRSWSVDPFIMVPYLTKALQEAFAEIEELRQEIAKLKQ